MGGGWGSWNFDTEFKFAKIQNSHVEGGWVGGGSWNLNAEFKFAKIQNSLVWWGGGGHCGTNFQLLLLSPNLLKKIYFCKKCSKFWGKNWNGFVLDFEYQVVPLYEV